MRSSHCCRIQPRLTEIPVVLYCTAAGAEPVREWLRSLSTEDRNHRGAKADEGNDEMSKLKKHPHWGSTLDEFLDETGIRETAKAEAITRVVAWQLSKEMKRQGMSKARLAKLMNTSRAQVDRILKAKGNVTIETLQRAAELVGRQLRLELV